VAGRLSIEDSRWYHPANMAQATKPTTG